MRFWQRRTSENKTCFVPHESYVYKCGLTAMLVCLCATIEFPRRASSLLHLVYLMVDLDLLHHDQLKSTRFSVNRSTDAVSAVSKQTNKLITSSSVMRTWLEIFSVVLCKTVNSFHKHCTHINKVNIMWL